MAFHHLALAVRDMRAVHDFYEHKTGFALAKVEIARTPTGGRAKHFFYDTGDGELMAFWELQDPALPSDFPTSIAAAAGLPQWVNHLAFKAADLDDLAARRQRWLDAGLQVMEIDHNWCHSIYTTDPNGNMVEFCVTTDALTAADRDQALAAVTSDEQPFSPPPAKIEIHEPAAS